VAVGIGPRGTLPISDVEARLDGRASAAAGSSRLRTRQEDHLQFGPRWRTLQQMRLGRGEALARLALGDEFVHDVDTFRLHPAMLDIATGYAMDLIPGYGDQDVPESLWVPIAYRSLKYYAPLPAEVVSWVRVGEQSSIAAGFATFDIALADTAGNVVVEVAGLTLRRTDGALRMPKPEPAPQGVEGDPVAARAKALSPAEEALQHNVTQGLATSEGLDALAKVLAGPLPPTLIVSSMDLRTLIAQADALSQVVVRSNETRFARPELESNFEAPRDEVEKSLAELWGKLLGVEGIGIRDSFFDLGGHSLIAVRLFNELSDRYGVDLPMSVLMQSPNIASLGELIRGGAPSDDGVAVPPAADNAEKQPRFQHIVPMHTGPVADGTPLFVVAGMFGNVLNLSHLAHLLGEERPFYALQARGLYGDTPPHETFEEMAAAYLEEIRQVQPHGPYLLGGFSGGGLIAFEMARRLVADGEKIMTILMLDTPVREIPNFGIADKWAMFVQGVRVNGISFLTEKVRRRMQWQREQRAAPSVAAADGGTIQFQSQRIGEAFMRALVRYTVPHVPVNVAVFRPKLDIRYRLRGGRLVDSKRDYIAPDNGWTPYVAELRVFEVPGNHDSMVLEPNVRVLVAQMRRIIDAAEKGARVNVAGSGGATGLSGRAAAAPVLSE
jgi:thioesterase domain-containing protein/acyl carrier protein